MKEDEVNTTGGKVKKEAIPGLEFESHEPIQSEKVKQLRKEAEQKLEEATRLEDEDRRKAAAKTPEGKLRQKQWEEYQATKKEEQEERERIHARLVVEARTQYKLRRLAERGDVKVNEDSKEYQDILKDIIDIYNLVQSHYHVR
ncbi:hypothetical protein ES705_11032 [subsurface metagenome]